MCPILASLFCSSDTFFKSLVIYPPNHHHYYQSPSLSTFFKIFLSILEHFFFQINFRISLLSSFYFTFTYYFFNILPLCRSKFPTYITFLPSRELPLTFPVKIKRPMATNSLNFCLSEKVFISLSLMKEILQGKEF